MNKFLELKGKVDWNDLEFVSKRFGAPIFGMPCPIIKNKINPHVTNFLMRNGQSISVFHIKPIYYLHHNGQWRPMEEIAYSFGNYHLNLKKDWEEKMDLRIKTFSPLTNFQRTI